MAATHSLDSIRSARPVLYLSFELSSSQGIQTPRESRHPGNPDTQERNSGFQTAMIRHDPRDSRQP
jgi:hypothetical protein